MHVTARRSGRRATPLLALLLALNVPPSGALAQEAPKNLQVLPEDMPRAQLTQVMRSFTMALGVRCCAATQCRSTVLPSARSPRTASAASRRTKSR